MMKFAVILVVVYTTVKLTKGKRYEIKVHIFGQQILTEVMKRSETLYKLQERENRVFWLLNRLSRKHQRESKKGCTR